MHPTSVCQNLGAYTPCVSQVVRNAVLIVIARVAVIVSTEFLSSRSRQLVIGAACALAFGASSSAQAQVLPSSPLSLADGRVIVAGDASVTVAPKDPGFFNYTDYDYSALRMLQIDVAGSVAAGDHVTLLGQVRTENDTGQLLALYARIRPWKARAIDIQVGRVPPTFGSFPRRAYSLDNPFIGYPLAYQYLTSLRSDALPANADELLRMRARG